MATTKDKILQPPTPAEQTKQKYGNVLSPQQSGAQGINKEMEQRGKELMQEGVTKTPVKQILETKPAEPKYETYEDMFRAMNTYTPPTTEELEAEKKKRKRNAMLNAVGDGISSLANIYYTTKGAPAVKYDPRANLSERSRARWDYLDKVRDAKTQQYIRGLAEAKAADKRKADADKKWREQMNLSLQLANEREELAALKAKLAAEEEAKNREYKTSEREASQEFKAKENEADRQTKITTANISQAGQNYRADNSAAQRGDAITDKDGQVYYLPKSIKDSGVSNIFKMLPDSLQKAAIQEFGVKSDYGQKRLTASGMRLAIGKYASQSPETMKLIKALSEGAAKVEKVKEGTNDSIDEFAQFEIKKDFNPEDYRRK